MQQEDWTMNTRLSRQQTQKPLKVMLHEAIRNDDF